MSKVIRQLPETDRLHVPDRSPVSWWMRRQVARATAPCGEHFADAVKKVWADAFSVIVFKKPFQAFMRNTAKFHSRRVVYGIAVRLSIPLYRMITMTLNDQIVRSMMLVHVHGHSGHHAKW
jgi:hypothetical protein